MVRELLWVIIVLCICASLRLVSMLSILRQGQPHKTKSERVACSPGVFVFLGSGGHTGEILRVLSVYKREVVCQDCKLYVGYSDVNSKIKFNNWLKSEDVQPKDIMYIKLFKAREVGSGTVRSIWSVLRTLIHAFGSMRYVEKKLSAGPHLVLLNGPGTCCILVLWLRVLEFFTFQHSKIMYVESMARTNTLSRTGQLLYPIVDEFVVQWPELARRYVRARYYGILI